MNVQLPEIRAIINLKQNTTKTGNVFSAENVDALRNKINKTEDIYIR